MKLKNKSIRLAGFILALAMVSGFAFGQQQKCQQQKGTNQYQSCMNLPGLTDEQKSKIEPLRMSHEKQMLTLRTEKQVLEAELNQLQIADAPDMNKIYSKIDEISAVKNKMAKERSKHQQDVRAILTPEQRLMFDNHQGQGTGHRGNGKSEGMPQGNCPRQQGKTCPNAN